jgi:UrcA family protein
MNIRHAMAAAMAFAALSSVPVAAQEPRSERVEYGDLNLSSEKGLQTLDRRLRHAIWRVCYQPNAWAIQQRKAAGKCRRDLRAKAQVLVEKVARGTVTLAGVISIKVDG